MFKFRCMNWNTIHVGAKEVAVKLFIDYQIWENLVSQGLQSGGFSLCITYVEQVTTGPPPVSWGTPSFIHFIELVGSFWTRLPITVKWFIPILIIVHAITAIVLSFWSFHKTVWLQGKSHSCRLSGELAIHPWCTCSSLAYGCFFDHFQPDWQPCEMIRVKNLDYL